MKILILLFVTVLFLQISKPQNGLCLTFVQTSSLGVFSSPALDKADFNNDGNEDIVSTGYITGSNTYFSSVTLFLSNGTGSFTTSNFTLNTGHTQVGDHIQFIKACDFNTDGKQDIFVLCSSDTIFLLTGTGTGSFNALANFTVPYAPTALVTSDFNNDGKTDVAISSNTTNSVSILLGNGTGGFASITHYNLTSSAMRLVTGDFNNNGTLDIFAITGGSSYFLKGGGNGTFTLTNGLNFVADDIKAVDVNSDNKLDLVYTDIAHNTLSIIKGNGNFAFGAPTSFSVSQIGGGSGNINFGPIHVGDFNKDGKTDIVVLSNYTGFSIFQGIGNGSFSSPVSYTVNQNFYNSPFNFVVTDIDNNSHPDIVALADNGGTIPFGELKVFLNCNTVGLLENFKTEIKLKLYPNPTADFLTLEFPGDSKIGFTELAIFNELGQLTMTRELDPNEANYRLNLTDLPEGIYSLSLQSNHTRVASNRFVISR